MATYKETNGPIAIKDLDVREMANTVAASRNQPVTSLCSEILRKVPKTMLPEEKHNTSR